MKHLQSLFGKLKSLTTWDIARILMPVFAFCIPFQKRIQLDTPFTLLNGSFNEYTTNFIYVTDLLAFVIVVFGFYSIAKKWKELSWNNHTFIVVLLLFLLANACSVSSQYLVVSLPFFARLCLFASFAFVVSKICEDRVILRLTLVGFALAGIFQSVIAILQFVFQKSLGLAIFGESVLSPDIVGVAKIVVSDEKIIRSYGTIPHPNVLGIFLAASILVTLFLLLTHTENIFSRVRFLILFWVGIELQVLALLLTFSRSAYIAFIFLVSAVLIPLMYSTWKGISNLSRKKLLLLIGSILFAAVGMVVLLWPFLSTRTQLADQNGDHALSERARLINVSRETFLENQFRGVGLHTLVLKQANVKDLEAWQLQPTHNIYWLILAESGTVGLAGLMILLTYTTKQIIKFLLNKDTGRDQKLLIATIIAIPASLLVVGFVDHHPWDIQQSQLIFWTFLGASLSMQQKLFHVKHSS